MRLRRLEPLLRSSLRGPCALPPGTRVLVAVSGGADSTALLLGLARVAPGLGLSLHAAHLHHGLRGRDADADLAFVCSLCARLGVPLAAARWNTRLRMRRRGLSGQAGLRRLRREFLLRTAQREACGAIATAHTADDQLETLLLRLGRGTGLEGLACMRPRQGPWLKPLLATAREWIEADLRRAGEPWREDGSNADRRYARNRLRHDAVPALVAAVAPRAAARRARAQVALNAARAVGEVAEASTSVAESATIVLSDACSIEGGEIALDSRKWSTYASTARRMALRQIWRRTAGPRPGLTHRHLEAFGRLLAGSRGGATVQLPGGWRAERDRRFVVLRAPGNLAGPGGSLRVPGRLRFGSAVLEGRWTSGSGALRRIPGKSREEEFFAEDELNGPLEIRSGRDEEWFTPFGRSRPARLGGFLRSQSVSRELKRNPTVLADAGGILWVVGVRRSARAPVTPGTRRALWVHAERHD